MKNTLKIVVGVCCVAALVFIVGNFDDTKNDKIKIGVIIPLTGTASNVTEDLNLLLNDYQKVAKNIEFVIQDDQCAGKNAISAYQMMKNQGIRIYMVACSGSILSLAPIMAEDGNVIVTGYGGSIEIRKTGDEVIRFIPDGLSIANGLIEEIKKTPDKKYAVLYENHDYPKSVVDMLNESVKSQILSVDSYNAADASFQTHILKLKASAADEVIYIPVGETAREIIYKEMKQLGLVKPLLGEVNTCDSTIAPKNFGLHGMCFKTFLKTDGFNIFVKDFNTAYGRDPQYPFYNSISLDIVEITDRLLEGVNSIDDVAIREFKDAILAGVTGDVTSYQFTADGEVIGGEYLERVDF